jgi:hypothetical protein
MSYVGKRSFSFCQGAQKQQSMRLVLNWNKKKEALSGSIIGTFNYPVLRTKPDFRHLAHTFTRKVSPPKSTLTL